MVDGRRFPGRCDMCAIFDDLLSGVLGREEVSAWTTYWDTHEDAVPEDFDPLVWHSIESLSMIDERLEDGSPLFSTIDIGDWRNQLGCSGVQGEGDGKRYIHGFNWPEDARSRSEKYR